MKFKVKIPLNGFCHMDGGVLLLKNKYEQIQIDFKIFTRINCFIIG